MDMKRTIAILFFFVPLIAFSQVEPGPEISVMSGYMWGGKLTTVNGDLKIEDGANLTVALDVPLASGITGELIYTRLDSELSFKGRDQNGRFVDTTFYDMSTNYIQLGGMRTVQTGTNLVPFGIFAIGATIFSPKSSTANDEWALSFALGGGLKYYLSDRIGLRLDGRFLFPVYLTGGGFFCGTGGCGAGIGSSPVVLQGFIDGGVILKLGS